jgi:hypothetical protein
VSRQVDIDRKPNEALELFIAGATYQQICDTLKLTQVQVDKKIRAGIAASQRRTRLLDEQASTLRTERTEALFRAHYRLALRGDHRSAEICRRLLSTPQLSKPHEGSVGGDADVVSLKALRDRLAAEIDQCRSPRDLAALSRQYIEVLDRLTEVAQPPAPAADDSGKPMSIADEIAARRAARQANTAG